MIDSLTKPNQILVIDDNQSWLNSVNELEIQVINSFSKTSFEIYKFIKDKSKELTIVIVNANIVFRFYENRLDFLGVDLVNNILQPHFSKIKFYVSSFTYSIITEEQQQINFIDFLMYLNQKCHYGKGQY